MTTTIAPTEPLTLARGAPLTPDTWADFVTRLRYDCVGEGVHDHCTADAIFTVQSRKRIVGIDKELIDQWLVHCDDSEWESPQEYHADCDEEGAANLDVLSQEHHGLDFLQLKESDQWDVLECLPDHNVTGWDERWEHVNSHFTRAAAEAFIRRKKHDHYALRVYVDSQYYSWEFNAIKEAILSGRLTLTA